MAIEDKDFIEKQIETGVKGLSKFFDVEQLEGLFKQKAEQQKQEDEHMHFKE